MKVEIGQRWMYEDLIEKSIIEITRIIGSAIYGKHIQVFYGRRCDFEFSQPIDRFNVYYSYLEGQDSPNV